jgi:hypothetical protein
VKFNLSEKRWDERNGNSVPNTKDSVPKSEGARIFGITKSGAKFGVAW